MPEDWIREDSKKGDGVIYRNPNDEGTYIKIQRGKPNSSNPGQRYDNVRWQKSGQSYDLDGNPVERKSLESHIPLEDFKFDFEVFK